jgi:uncharacterized integral membrane protein (TIGR00698 family)
MIFLPLRMWAASTRAGQVLPGLLLCSFLAAVSTAIAAWGGSGVVWALLIGAAIASVRVPSVLWAPGVEFAGKHVLRIGVALLGLQISSEAFHVLSPASIGALAVDVVTVLLIGCLLGPVMGIERRLALVLAASVAICGASAAAAFALVLTPNDEGRRNAGVTIGLVSLLSMAAMLAYAPLTQLMNLDPGAAGYLLGGTIHEVVHAVAAGYSIDQATGDIATMTKLLRVAMLAPALLLTSWTLRVSSECNAAIRPPWFLICFTLFAIANVLGLIPRNLNGAAASVSRFCLIGAMAAIGLSLPWRSLSAYGWRPVAMLLILSGLLFSMVVAFTCIMPL